MNLLQNYLTNNPCYYSDGSITVKGIMLHSVGCPQPDGKVWCNVYNGDVGACVHAFIDANDGKIYQTLPWNHRGWHGGGSSNDTHIGVEMCESNYIAYTSGANFTVSNLSKAQAHAKTAYNSAVELFAMLCKQFNLNPLTQICSHSEGYKKGIASNHADPEHYWKGLQLSYTMDGFRKDVKNKMGSGSNESNTAATTQSTENNSSFLVRIKITDLRIRSGPGTNYASKGYIKPCVYTIVSTKVSGGYTWGKLKSGAGWIALEYTERVTARN